MDVAARQSLAAEVREIVRPRIVVTNTTIMLKPALKLRGNQAQHRRVGQ
jgi:hypothetical protein